MIKLIYKSFLPQNIFIPWVSLNHMKKKLKRYFIFAGILIFIIAWILILNSISPDSIVAKIGVGNSYIILFLISAIGGVSSISASSYYLAVSVFASGGLNPVFLGLVGGVGVTIGDSLFFYLGKKAEKIFTFYEILHLHLELMNC